MNKLAVSKEFEVLFSEVDSMNVVWHGAYPLYLEDAREKFGAEYGLEYLTIFSNGYFAPLVDVHIKYHKPLRYGSHPRIDIVYVPTEAAKIVFDYEIRDMADDSLVVTARTIQVFMDRDYQLVWDNPPFYQQWKERMGVMEELR